MRPRRMILGASLALVAGIALACASPTQAPAAQSAAPAQPAAPSSQPAAQPQSQRLQPEQTRVAVAHGSAAGEAGVVWVAIEKGYFAEYGLQVDSLYTQTVAGIQSLIAGENQFGQTGCSDIMASRRGGSDLTINAATNPRK